MFLTIRESLLSRSTLGLIRRGARLSGKETGGTLGLHLGQFFVQFASVLFLPSAMRDYWSDVNRVARVSYALSLCQRVPFANLGAWEVTR